MNTTRQKIVTIIAGTASIVSLQMFGFLDLPEPRMGLVRPVGAFSVDVRWDLCLVLE